MSKVTVVISTCDRPVKLRAAIRSVIAQTFTDWELKVVGDKCGDETRVVVHEFSDSRVEYINLEKRHGKQDHGSTPKNVGVAAGHGEYVAYLDDDDVYMSDHLEKCVKYLDQHLDVGMVYGCSAVYKFLDFRRSKVRNRTFDAEVHENHPFINTCEVVHRRALQSELGELWKTCGYYNDWDLWKRISRIAKIVHLPHVAATQHFAHDVLLKNERQRVRRLGRPSPLLSIIIGVRGRTRYLAECVRRLEEQIASKDLFELIVVDQGSNEESRTAYELFSGLKRYFLLHDDGPYHRGWVNNVGAKCALGDFFCFLDCDCLLPNNFINQFVSILETEPDRNFHVRVRRKWLTEIITERIFSKTIGFADAMRFGEPDTNTHALGSGKIVPRDAFFSIRGFDEMYDKGWGFEDVDLHERLIHAKCRDVEMPQDLVSQYHLWHPTSEHPRVERGDHYVYWKRMSRLKRKNDPRYLKRNNLIDWGSSPREIL